MSDRVIAVSKLTLHHSTTPPLHHALTQCSVDRLTNAEKEFVRSVCQAALDGRLPIPVGISLQMQSIDFTEPEQVGDRLRDE